MTFESDYLELMPYSVTVQHTTSRDSYGKKTYDTGASYRARVSYTPTRIVTVQGEEVTANGMVWFAGTVSPALSTTDQLTLPDGSTRDLLRVDVLADETGEHHTKAYF